MVVGMMDDMAGNIVERVDTLPGGTSKWVTPAKIRETLDAIFAS